METTFTFTKAELEELLSKARESSIGQTVDGTLILFDFTIDEVIAGIVCTCENRQDQYQKDCVWYCGDCDRKIKAQDNIQPTVKVEKKVEIGRFFLIGNDIWKITSVGEDNYFGIQHSISNAFTSMSKQDILKCDFVEIELHFGCIVRPIKILKRY